MRLLLLICIFGLTSSVTAQDLVYTPKIPSFGGNPYYAQYFLSTAEAQNSFKDETSMGEQLSELELFQKSLNNQLLGQVSRSMFSEQFGEDGFTPGTYNYGNLALDIYESTEGLVINILDTNTGEQTQVIIPNT